MADVIDPFRLMANAMPDPMCLLTDDGTIRSANPALCRLLGARAGDLLNKSLGEISENRAAEIQAKLSNWRKSGSPTPSAIDFHAPNANALKCVAYGCVLRFGPADAGRSLILLRIKTRENTNQGFAALNKEIKQLEDQIIERKRAEAELIASESRVRLLLESAGEMIFGIDARGHLTFVNPAFMGAVGYPDPDVVLGENAFQILQHRRPDGTLYAADENPIRQAIVNNRPVHNDNEFFSRNDGSRFPVEYRAFPIVRDGAVVGAVVTASDISERVQAQEEILRLNRDLEKRVAERTAELELAITRLAQSEKLAALGNLVAGIAHEINTPVGIGVTSASHLQERNEHFQRLYEDNKLTKGDFERYMRITRDSSEIILTNLKRAADLVRSFKQLAVDQVSESRRSFNVKQYTEEIVQSLHPELKNIDYQLDIHCPENIDVNSFPGAYSQIITNLVLNSLVHGFDGRESGEISMDIASDEHYLTLAYRDNGRGMDEDGVKRIFDPFYSTRRGRGGSGLGMHIVYNLVTNTFEGSIDCTSRPDNGVLFRMKLRAPREGRGSAGEAEPVRQVM